MNLLFIALLFIFGTTAFSGCCPPGGVWSEWATGPCPTTCGGFSNVTRTRTCTDRCGDCPCAGPDSDVGPCGLALCPFGPGAVTCNKPYVKSYNYETNTFFCGIGNIPKAECRPSPDSVACCPPGGVWSEWVTGPCPTTCGGFTNVTRTRTCTNRCGNCTCSGPDSDVGPCGLALCPFGPGNTVTCNKPYIKRYNYESNDFFCGSDNVEEIKCIP